MSHAPHSNAPVSVPAEMIAERRAGWHAFTRFVTANCVAIVILLLGMLLFLRIL